MCNLTEPHFSDPDAARKYVEAIRWPNGPVCGRCGETERLYETKRPGRYRCGNPGCRKDFTVTTGTVMESSHIPLNKWLIAFYLMASSKKGISAHQLHRTLGIQYRSAWFLAHRVREAMRAGGLDAPMGGDGKTVEANETYHGKPDKSRYGPANKRAVVSLVERGAASGRGDHPPSPA